MASQRKPGQKTAPKASKRRHTARAGMYQVGHFDRRRLPVQERSSASEAAILQASSELFAKLGYEKTKVTHIAKRAGVSIGTFYEYFPNKDAIVAELSKKNLEASLQLAEQMLNAVIANGIQTADLIRTLIESWMFYFEKVASLYRVLFDAPHTQELRQIAREGHRHLAEILYGHLKTDCALRVTNPLLAAELVITTIRMLVLEYVFESTPSASRTEFISETTALLTRYLK